MAFEDLEKLRERQAEAKRHVGRLKPPEITTVDDIRRVLVILDPSSRANTQSEEISLSAQLVGTDQNNERQTYKVSAKAKAQSYRDILLKGFELIKQRRDLAEEASEARVPVEVNGTAMVPPQVLADPDFIAIDPIIKRLLSGYRSGMFIQWDLSDGYTYKYDIYTHKLTRFRKEEE